jgi:hypothetical protein
MKRKPCVGEEDCRQPKKAGHPNLCVEGWLRRQPAITQAGWANRRLGYIPQSLRKARVPERDWPPGRRWCSGCQTFVRLRDCSPGASRCRACASAVAHGKKVESTYGISQEQYRALWVAQGGRCYICQRKTHTRRLAVDHDHVTGEVRGLLCADNERGCNFAIVGNMLGRTPEDRAMMAMRVVEYLLSPPAKQILT